MLKILCTVCGTRIEANEFINSVCKVCGCKIFKSCVNLLAQNDVEENIFKDRNRDSLTKEYFLKKSETYIFLDETNEAETIYRQLIKEFPEEYRAYIGLAKVLLHCILPLHSRKEMVDISGGVVELPSYLCASGKFAEYEILECERKAKLLSTESVEIFEEIWEEYENRYKKYKMQLEVQY